LVCLLFEHMSDLIGLPPPAPLTKLSLSSRLLLYLTLSSTLSSRPDAPRALPAAAAAAAAAAKCCQCQCAPRPQAALLPSTLPSCLPYALKHSSLEGNATKSAAVASWSNPRIPLPLKEEEAAVQGLCASASRMTSRPPTSLSPWLLEFLLHMRLGGPVRLVCLRLGGPLAW
jgi:hypothetical protein